MGKTAFYLLIGHDLKLFLGAIVAAYLMLAGIADATPSANVTFVTTGFVFVAHSCEVNKTIIAK